jgi:hypothetical protein
MTNEPPKGFKTNLIRSFANLIKEEDYEGMSADKVMLLRCFTMYCCVLL